MSHRIQIAGVPFDPVTYEQAVARIQAYLLTSGQHHIATPNPEMVLHARTHKTFQKILNETSLNIPDGIGVLWAATFLQAQADSGPKRLWQLFKTLALIPLAPARVRRIMPDRVTGTDLFYRLMGNAQHYGWKVFLLGAGPGVAEKAASNLRKLYPQVRIVGTLAGVPDASGDREAIHLIRAVAPDLLFVAYGSPAQELWIHRNLAHLPSVKVAMGVGGAFDFAAGDIRRAPAFMRRAGLEWLWRFVHQPHRHKRIRNATLGFISLIWKEKKAVQPK